MFHYYIIYILSSFMHLFTPVSCTFLTCLLHAHFTTSLFTSLYLLYTTSFILYYSYCLYMAILSHLHFKIATHLLSLTSAIYKKPYIIQYNIYSSQGKWRGWKDRKRGGGHRVDREGRRGDMDQCKALGERSRWVQEGKEMVG